MFSERAASLSSAGDDGDGGVAVGGEVAVACSG